MFSSESDIITCPSISKSQSFKVKNYLIEILRRYIISTLNELECLFAMIYSKGYISKNYCSDWKKDQIGFYYIQYQLELKFWIEYISAERNWKGNKYQLIKNLDYFLLFCYKAFSEHNIPIIENQNEINLLFVPHTHTTHIPWKIQIHVL